MSDENIKIEIGQLWWDKNHCWCDGSVDIDICYLILSANCDTDGVIYWQCARFLWAGGGYCGADTREFTEDEILLMELVGSINDIKSPSRPIK